MIQEIHDVLESCGVEGIEETSEGFTACCPFHEDSKPSWNINGENGLWKCHGCGEKGNFIQLVSRLMDIPMQEAKARYLRCLDWPMLRDRADETEVENPPLDERILIPYSAQCPRYMLDRGFKKSFLRQHEIGYDPEAMRVTIPVRDGEGRLIGITRRATLASQQPKYLHSTFKKSKVLYLGHKLVDMRGRIVVITEGQLDALRLQFLIDSGFEDALDKARAVATLGASLSPHQAKLIAYSDAVPVLAYDNDPAGELGTEQAIEALLAKGIRTMYRLRYPTKDPGDLAYGAAVNLTEI